MSGIWGRLPPALGWTGVLLLVLAPLPIGWAGLAGLAAALGARLPTSGGRARTPGGLPPPLLLPLTLLLLGAAAGRAISLRADSADVRLAGLLGAIGALLLLLDWAWDVRRAAAVARVTRLGLLLIIPPLLLIVALEPAEESRMAPVASLLEHLPWVVDARRVLLDAGDGLLGHRIRLSSAGLGMLAACGLALGWGRLLSPTTPGGCRRELIWAGCFFLLLLLAGSRGAFISALSVLALLLGLAHGARWFLASVLVVAGLLGGLILLYVAAVESTSWLPVRQYFGNSLNQRFEIWQNVVFLLGDVPFTGVGIGPHSLKLQYAEYFSPHRLSVHHVHNLYLQSYVELGLAGCLGIVVLLGSTIFVAWRNLRAPQEPAKRANTLSALGVLVTLGMVGLTEIAPLSSVGLLLLFGSVGLLVAQNAARSEEPGRSTPHRAMWAAMWLLLSVLIAAPALAIAGALSWTTPATAYRAIPVIGAELAQNLGALALARLQYADALSQRSRDALAQQAETALGEALAARPGSVSLHRVAGSIAAARSRRDDALLDLDIAMSNAHGGDNLQLFQIGRLYREAGAWQAALVTWAEVDPRYGIWTGSDIGTQLVEWGSELVRRGRLEQALAVNRAAVAASPLSRTPYRSLAMATERALGQPVAVQEMQTLAAAYPNVPWPYLETARLLRLSGFETEQANAWGRRALEVWESEAWVRQWEQAATRGEPIIGGGR